MRTLALKLRLEASRAAERQRDEVRRRRRSRQLRRLGTLTLATLVTLGAALAYPALSKLDGFLGATWQQPWFLVALVSIPIVFWRTTYGEDHRQPRLRLGTVAGLTAAPGGLRVWLRDVPGVLRSVALALGIAALARPVSVMLPTTSENEGIDAVIVLDLSGSMRAVLDNLPDELAEVARKPKRRGVRPTRLDAAKAVISDFISRRQTDRIGVVVFGKAAYVLSPPTLDYQLLHQLVQSMELELIDNSATAIGDAVGTAVARLRRSNAKSKAVILLTDGDSNAGSVSPELAARLATKENVKVFSIQIGDGTIAEIQDGFDLFGQPRYLKTQSPVNPELLKTIAESTGGEMYIATDARALQASFHSVLDRLEKSRSEATIATFEDLYRFLLLPAVLLIALESLLRAFVLRRFP